MAATDPQPMILRVVEPDRVRKVKLSSRPASVDALIRILKEQLELAFDFSLEYEDPDFDGNRTELGQIEELPQKAVVHILPSKDSCSTSTASTELLSDLSDVPSPERKQRWPTGEFEIPKFSFDVELVLQRGNAEYEKNGKHLKLKRDQKHDILEALAKAIFSFKAYDKIPDREQVAKALVNKHPCLKEAGSATGWTEWVGKIKEKMGNFRGKLKKAGCLEVSVNSGKRSRNHPENESPHTNIKRPRRAEVNYLPNFPQGHDEASLELLRNNIVEEVQKTERHLPLISKMMQTTLALRRQTIVTAHPPVREILDQWPALRMQSEVYAEFQRITNQNLPNTFYAELDRHTPRLMAMLRLKASKTGKIAEALAEIFKAHDEQELHDIHTRRTTVLHALPVFLREDASAVFKTCTEEDEDDPGLFGAVSLLTAAAVGDNLKRPIHYNPKKVTIIIEGDDVLSLPQFPDAVAVVFGLMYGLHLTYPKGVTNTFEFIQKVLLGLDGGKLSPRVQSLKNELLMSV